MINRYWTTFHDGFYCVEIAPEGKGFWVKYLDHVKELEQEQTSHAETHKLLLKACNERDSLLESIGHICDSARIAAASALGFIGGTAGKGVPKPRSGNRNAWLTCPYCPPGSRKWQHELSLETHVSQVHPNGE